MYKDLETQRAAKRRYYYANKEHIRDYQNAYYSVNKDAIKKATRTPQQRASQKAYAEAHKEEIAKNKHAAYLRSIEKNKVAAKWRGLKNLYGLTQDDYNQMFNDQGGCCALCGKHQSELKQTLRVDHDHKTDKIRSLLCHHCNVALGFFKEDVEILQKAITYITENQNE